MYTCNFNITPKNHYPAPRRPSKYECNEHLGISFIYTYYYNLVGILDFDYLVVNTSYKI